MFVADGGEPVALCGADANLAATLGAAFSMLPVAAAKDAAKTRELTPVMIENMREIMNICTRLVMDEYLAAFEARSALSEQIAARRRRRHCWRHRPGRREFQVQLPKYGGGVLTFLTV